MNGDGAISQKQQQQSHYPIEQYISVVLCLRVLR